MFWTFCVLKDVVDCGTITIQVKIRKKKDCMHWSLCLEKHLFNLQVYSWQGGDITVWLTFCTKLLKDRSTSWMLLFQHTVSHKIKWLSCDSASWECLFFSLLCKFILDVFPSVCLTFREWVIRHISTFPKRPQQWHHTHTHKYTRHKLHSSLSGFKSLYSPKTLTHRKSFQPDIAVCIICLQPSHYSISPCFQNT